MSEWGRTKLSMVPERAGWHVVSYYDDLEAVETITKTYEQAERAVEMVLEFRDDQTFLPVVKIEWRDG